MILGSSKTVQWSMTRGGVGKDSFRIRSPSDSFGKCQEFGIERWGKDKVVKMETVAPVKGLPKKDEKKPYVHLGSKSTPDISLSDPNVSHPAHFFLAFCQNLPHSFIYLSRGTQDWLNCKTVESGWLPLLDFRPSKSEGAQAKIWSRVVS